MFGKSWSRKWWAREVVIAGGALLAGLVASQAFAVEPPVSRKMERQIDVMERIIDQVLIDSPNFLVSGRGTTRGLYIGDYGVIFTFAASLVERGNRGWNLDFGKDGFRIIDEDGKKVIVIDPDDLDDEELEDLKDLDDHKDRRADGVGERLYKRGKAEIVDVLLDYGDSISTLKDGQWVTIVAYLRDSSFFTDQRISRLVLKAKIDDLRSFAGGRLSEEELVKRIVEEEY